MSKMSNSVKASNIKGTYGGKRILNHMNGGSFTINPLETLKMISASSIFGEPSYYRNGEFAKKTLESTRVINDYDYKVSDLTRNYVILPNKYEGKKTSEIMESAIDASLDYNFEETIKWAEELRTGDYNMRLNPQVIMVRAAEHPKRVEFTTSHPCLFNEINKKVMSRMDEPATQLTYWLYKHGNKNGIPTILKKGWAKKYEGAKRYHIAKYKNTGIGMIDTIRVCHANGTVNPLIDELMKTGSVKFEDNNTTWENLKSQGKNWNDILNTINIPHMALLRNLKNIFSEIDDNETCEKVLSQLKEGVPYGKQFPFRYYTAKNILLCSCINFQAKVLDALEECMDIATKNMPTLKGKTICLSDNSGSAWGSCNSDYGMVTIADIANLSSVITAQNSDEGYVGTFGDELKITPISKRNGILSQHEKVTDIGKTVGQATENGIWIFLRDAITKNEHWDNIFIYSDQQAGHGGLYGTSSGKDEYLSDYGCNGNYVDVIKLVNEYRNKVNPKVNVFSTQVAGYDNILIPENLYRTSILQGWTGKEALYADIINKQWDSIDLKNEQKKQ